MNAVETRARGMNPTMRRLYLLDNGWSKGRNDNDWRHPNHGGGHSLAVAVRIAMGEESK